MPPVFVAPTLLAVSPRATATSFPECLICSLQLPVFLKLKQDPLRFQRVHSAQFLGFASCGPVQRAVWDGAGWETRVSEHTRALQDKVCYGVSVGHCGGLFRHSSVRIRIKVLVTRERKCMWTSTAPDRDLSALSFIFFHFSQQWVRLSLPRSPIIPFDELLLWGLPVPCGSFKSGFSPHLQPHFHKPPKGPELAIAKAAANKKNTSKVWDGRQTLWA